MEKDLYGTELQGSLADRQSAHIDFLEKGSDGQPSLLFKLSVAEWGLEVVNNAALPLAERIPVVERRLEGASQEGKPMAMRVERVLGLVVSDPITWQLMPVPSGTVVRLALMETLRPAVARKTTPSGLPYAEPAYRRQAGGASRRAGPGADPCSPEARRFRASLGNQNSGWSRLSTLGADVLPLTEGESRKKPRNFEASYAAAAGTSLIGAIALGPVGPCGRVLRPRRREGRSGGLRDVC